MDPHEARRQWDTAAPRWAKWERRIGTWLAHSTERMLDEAAIGSGSRVLDVACGAGDQSLAAARRVGPSGTVEATDISPAMVEFVRERARAEGLDQVSATVSSADDLAVDGAPFDAAICRLGLMLLPDTGAALVAAGRALRHGGRFAAVVVGDPAANPLLARPLEILRRHADAPAPLPGRPGIFALADVARLRTLFHDAGYGDVAVSEVEEVLEMPSAADVMTMIQEAFGVYRAIIGGQTAPVRERAWGDVLEALRVHENDDGFRVNGTFLVVAGTLDRA